MTEHERIAVASECLRKLWQILDAGGRSIGRTREAVLLETAMDLIPYDNCYSRMADEQNMRFEKIREDARHEVAQERTIANLKTMGLE